MISLLGLSFYLALGESRLTCNRYHCRYYSQSNMICEEGCMTLGCQYDSFLHSDNSYLSFKYSDCFEQCICDEVKLTNGICDPECDNAFCGYDLGDCGYCSSGCLEKDLVSDTCKPDCLAATCEFYIQNLCFIVECAPGCTNIDMYSNTCKEECLAKSCLIYGDSTCSLSECAPGCKMIMIGTICVRENVIILIVIMMMKTVIAALAVTIYLVNV